jgi:hypothetical protein
MKVDYEWQRPYVAAVLETDRTKLPQRVAEAHAAIKLRLGELNQDYIGTAEERKLIEAALSGLNLLSQEITGPKTRSLSGSL